MGFFCFDSPIGYGEAVGPIVTLDRVSIPSRMSVQAGIIKIGLHGRSCVKDLRMRKANFAGATIVGLLCIGWALSAQGGAATSEAAAQSMPKAAETLAAEVAAKGWIVFSAPVGDGDWDLFLMRPDGSQRRKLLGTSDNIEAGARFSPDGKKLLYYRIPKSDGLDNNKYGTYELVLANSDGSGEVVWGKGFNWACWGPRSDQIACLGANEIIIHDVATKQKVRSIAARGFVEQLNWSRDGLYFSATANGLGPYWNIGCVSVQGGSVKAVSEIDRYNCTSDWMADAANVIYARGIIPEKGGRAELWLASADGKTSRMLYAEKERHVYGGCSSPDGKYLLMTRSQDDLGEANAKIVMALIRMADTPMLGAPDAEQIKRYPAVKAGPRLDLPTGWEPDWTYAEITAPKTAAIAPPSTSRSVAASEASVAELKREVHDKGWIIFSAKTPAGDWDLFLMRPDGSGKRNLTNTPETSEFLPLPSPDGTRLMFRRAKASDTLDNNRFGTQGQLVIANIDASNPQAFGKDGEYTWGSWLPDGKSICCLSPKGVSIIELASKKVVRQIPRGGFFQQFTVSPDGKWMSGVSNSFGAEWMVGRMEFATGKANVVSDVDSCTPDWFPDSSHIVFSHKPKHQEGNDYGWTQLWMADGDGKNRRLIYGEDGRHVYGGLISPVSKYVMFTGNKEEDGDPSHEGTPMGLMRLSDAPTIGGPSKALRKVHPNTKDGPVLKLPSGFEPCWIAPSVKMPAATEAK